MRVIVAGTRGITDYQSVERAIDESGFVVTELVSGHCRGVDQLAERWAILHDVKQHLFLARWKYHGRAAGPLRNAAMAEYAEALVAIWDGKSRGTASMIRLAKSKGLSVYVHQQQLAERA